MEANIDNIKRQPESFTITIYCTGCKFLDKVAFRNNKPWCNYPGKLTFDINTGKCNKYRLIILNQGDNTEACPRTLNKLT